MDAANWNENTGERRARKHASGVRRRAGGKGLITVPRLRPILLRPRVYRTKIRGGGNQATTQHRSARGTPTDALARKDAHHPCKKRSRQVLGIRNHHIPSRYQTKHHHRRGETPQYQWKNRVTCSTSNPAREMQSLSTVRKTVSSGRVAQRKRLYDHRNVSSGVPRHGELLPISVQPAYAPAPEMGHGNLSYQNACRQTPDLSKNGVSQVSCQTSHRGKDVQRVASRHHTRRQEAADRHLGRYPTGMGEQSHHTG